MANIPEIELEINFTNGVPIYIQLKETIKHWILVGKFPPGTQLPTVRQLAVAAKINPNTVSRVYSELEDEWILASKQGRGTFVKSIEAIPSDTGRKELEREVERLLHLAYELGYSVDDLQRIIAELIERK